MCTRNHLGVMEIGLWLQFYPATVVMVHNSANNCTLKMGEFYSI